MKIALITDTHFGARNDNLAFNDYFYKFWEETFFPYLEEKGIDEDMGNINRYLQRFASKIVQTYTFL